MDMLRVMIIGPDHTPYANGCFFFDIKLPSNYPEVAPEVKFLSTGGGSIRFNPNLYKCGNVCLSLLGTWSGPGWVSGHSTLLQVLVSIQSLILVPDPYYNEPAHERVRETEHGAALSKAYNQDIRKHTLTVMTCHLSSMLGNSNEYGEFESAMSNHFFEKRSSIQQELSSWMKDDGKLAPIVDKIFSLLEQLSIRERSATETINLPFESQIKTPPVKNEPPLDRPSNKSIEIDLFDDKELKRVDMSTTSPGELRLDRDIESLISGKRWALTATHDLGNNENHFGSSLNRRGSRIHFELHSHHARLVRDSVDPLRLRLTYTGGLAATADATPSSAAAADDDDGGAVVGDDRKDNAGEDGDDGEDEDDYSDGEDYDSDYTYETVDGDEDDDDDDDGEEAAAAPNDINDARPLTSSPLPLERWTFLIQIPRMYPHVPPRINSVARDFVPGNMNLDCHNTSDSMAMAASSMMQSHLKPPAPHQILIKDLPPTLDLPQDGSLGVAHSSSEFLEVCNSWTPVSTLQDLIDFLVGIPARRQGWWSGQES
jgi:ubiquitin-protein ligase